MNLKYSVTQNAFIVGNYIKDKSLISMVANLQICFRVS